MTVIHRLQESRAVALVLAVISASCVLSLAAMTATGTHSPATGAIKVLLVLSFIPLAVVDFRASVAIAIIELVLAGTTGGWVYFTSKITGRIFLDSVVMIRAVTIIAGDWRRTRQLKLGRYGLHALTVALVIPLVWIPLGLYYGNVRGSVIGDGDGFVFFAFILVVVALLLRGQGAWFRNLFLAACAANGVITLVLVTITATKLVALYPTMSSALLDRLGMGGIVGYQGIPGQIGNGAYRLFTGSSLFLQVGLALVAWRLVTRPRQSLALAALCRSLDRSSRHLHTRPLDQRSRRGDHGHRTRLTDAETSGSGPSRDGRDVGILHGGRGFVRLLVSQLRLSIARRQS